MFRFNIQTAIVLLAFVTAPDAWAKRLYEIDGIELRGGARIVTYGAATCNVKEGSHSAAEYERIKDNDGQPLDVWQLDFSVYNGSGKWLDHLVARYGIESKWPDCTSWDGPTGTYSEPLQWADTIGIIQESGRNVVAPGATLTDSAFILVFHQDQPHFSNWSVDFRFGDAPHEEPGNADRPTIVPEAQEQPFQIDAQQMCDSKPKGSACWEKLTNISECYTWIPQSRPNYQIVTWTGDCSEGLAQGVGTWKMQSLYPTVEGTGLLQKGKKQGHWVERSLR